MDWVHMAKDRTKCCVMNLWISLKAEKFFTSLTDFSPQEGPYSVELANLLTEI
jgi:hypothetical protein